MHLSPVIKLLDHIVALAFLISELIFGIPLKKPVQTEFWPFKLYVF